MPFEIAVTFGSRFSLVGASFDFILFGTLSVFGLTEVDAVGTCTDESCILGDTDTIFN